MKQALAHAAEWRDSPAVRGERYVELTYNDTREVLSDLVVLADEVLRLRAENEEQSIDMQNQCAVEDELLDRIGRLTTEIDGLKSGRFNAAITLTDADLRGSYGEMIIMDESR